MSFLTLFALVLPSCIGRHDMWQKEANGSDFGFNAEENGSAR
jgi:hypothetical protein